MWGFFCGRAALGLLQGQSGAGESIQRMEYIIIYSSLSPWQLMCSSFSTSCSVLGAPLGFSGCLKGLWNEKVLQWILSFFSGCKLWVRSLSQISGVFLVFAYMNGMISGSRLGLWHPVMILNWRMISGGKTLLSLLHIILTECIFLI